MKNKKNKTVTVHEWNVKLLKETCDQQEMRGEYYNVPYYIIDQLFSTKFKAQCRMDPKGGWNTVHAGAAKTTLRPPDEGDMLPSNIYLKARWTPPKQLGNPVCAYQQGNRPLCAYYSAASALNYFGDIKAARALCDLAFKRKQGSKWDEPFRAINECVRSFGYDPTKFEKAKHLPDAIHYVRIAQLLGSDGGVGHAVGFCGGWIFDSNLQHAMKHTQENLDWCVSSEQQAARYKCTTFNDYILVPQKQAMCFRLPDQQNKYNL